MYAGPAAPGGAGSFGWAAPGGAQVPVGTGLGGAFQAGIDPAYSAGVAHGQQLRAQPQLILGYLAQLDPSIRAVASAILLGTAATAPGLGAAPPGLPGPRLDADGLPHLSLPLHLDPRPSPPNGASSPPRPGSPTDPALARARAELDYETRRIQRAGNIWHVSPAEDEYRRQLQRDDERRQQRQHDERMREYYRQQEADAARRADDARRQRDHDEQMRQYYRQQEEYRRRMDDFYRRP